MPDNARKIYDMHEVIHAVTDDNSFFEIQKEYAKNIIIGYAFIAGHEVGIVANQPKYMAGALDSAASEKAARFIRQCDCFQIPLITLVDVPGFFLVRNRNMVVLYVGEPNFCMLTQKPRFLKLR